MQNSLISGQVFALATVVTIRSATCKRVASMSGTESWLLRSFHTLRSEHT